MSVFFISLVLELFLVSKLARNRININKDANIKLLAISMVLMVLVYSINNQVTFLYYYLLPVFVYIFYMDRKTYLIINEFNILLFILGLIYLIFSNQLFPNIFVSLAFFIIMIIVALLEKIIKKEVMGDGDLKLFVVMSLMFSYKILFVIIIASAIALAFYYLKRIVRRRGDIIPFGPYLVTGFIIVMIFF